jgi:hypothetical protein
LLLTSSFCCLGLAHSAISSVFADATYSGKCAFDVFEVINFLPVYNHTGLKFLVATSDSKGLLIAIIAKISAWYALERAAHHSYFVLALA